jgi:hypothetical protein
MHFLSYIPIHAYIIVFIWRVAHMEEIKGARRILVEKTRVKRRLGRYGCRWKNDIKMDLKQED